MRMKNDFVTDQYTIDWGLGIELFIHPVTNAVPAHILRYMIESISGAEIFAIGLMLKDLDDKKDRGLKILNGFCKSNAIFAKKYGISPDEHDATDDLPKHIEEQRELETGSDSVGEPID